MSNDSTSPIRFPTEVEARIQKIALHTGYTREEVVQGFVVSLLDMTHQPGDTVKLPGFVLMVKKALHDPDPAA